MFVTREYLYTDIDELNEKEFTISIPSGTFVGKIHQFITATNIVVDVQADGSIIYNNDNIDTDGGELLIENFTIRFNILGLGLEQNISEIEFLANIKDDDIKNIDIILSDGGGVGIYRITNRSLIRLWHILAKGETIIAIEIEVHNTAWTRSELIGGG